MIIGTTLLILKALLKMALLVGTTEFLIFAGCASFGLHLLLVGTIIISIDLLTRYLLLVDREI